MLGGKYFCHNYLKISIYISTRFVTSSCAHKTIAYRLSKRNFSGLSMAHIRWNQRRHFSLVKYSKKYLVTQFIIVVD